uniref:NnrS protein n=1 Tax=mine drainage metagenome TaxID=410659 RepID=E6Q301_9ZZZZ
MRELLVRAPRWALALAQLAHAASWVLLFWIATSQGIVGLTPAAIAWIHLVALGWITLTALAILIPLIPATTGVSWKAPRLQHLALAGFAVGAICFPAAWLAFERAIPALGGILVVAAIFYVALALWTLAGAARGERVERAVARAFSLSLLIFAVVAIIGATLAGALAAADIPAWFGHLARAHGLLALLGWLTLLIYGVSARTLRLLFAVHSRLLFAHIVVGTLGMAGAVVLAAGAGAGSLATMWVGAVAMAIAAVAYAVDTLDIVARAQGAMVVRSFVVASVLWSLVAAVLGIGTLLGHHWGDAFGYVVLVGWVGQMLDAHLASLARPLPAWLSFAAFQSAVLYGLVGLLSGIAASVALAAAFGGLGWCAAIVAIGSNYRPIE